MKTKILLFISCYIVWVFLDWPLDIQHALVGIIAALVVAFLTGHMFKRPTHAGMIRIFYGLCLIVPLFIWESLRANFNFILKVLHPQIPVNASIVEVKTTLKTSMGITFLANLVMLASQGICIDVSTVKSTLCIHWISSGGEDPQQAAQSAVNRFEKILKIIFY